MEDRSDNRGHGPASFAATRRRPKLGTLLLIALLHVAALYGLARVFAPGAVASVERSVVETLTVTVTTREAPAEQSESDEGAAGDAGTQATPRSVTAPPMPIPMPSPTAVPRASSTGAADRSGARDSGEGTGASGEGLGTGSGRGGLGTGGGIATRPSVRSGNLDQARDFPVPSGGRQARFGKSVTVVFTVTPEGRARDCSVASTQVDAETTALVCPLVQEKIRFNPARRADGRAVEARYGYRVDFSAR